MLARKDSGSVVDPHSLQQRQENQALNTLLGLKDRTQVFFFAPLPVERGMCLSHGVLSSFWQNMPKATVVSVARCLLLGGGGGE